jgi:hypothetical protein
MKEAKEEFQIRAFLKSRSHVIKLTRYERNEIGQVTGYKLLGET